MQTVDDLHDLLLANAAYNFIVLGLGLLQFSGSYSNRVGNALNLTDEVLELRKLFVPRD